MKKLLVLGLTVGVIVIGLLAYKLGYKASARDFIGKDTKFIYANEDLGSKDFNQLLQFIPDKKNKQQFEENIHKLNHISKIYAFSNRPFYKLNEKNLVVVIDTGYIYPLYMTQLNKYFDVYKNGIFIMKPQIRDQYAKNLEDVYLYPYRGLFILATKSEILQDFIKNKKNYVYNENIENFLDENRDNLLGALFYNNTEDRFYGINYVTITGTVKKDKLEIKQQFLLDDKAAERYRSSIEQRDLIKYVGSNDVYLATDDFSQMDTLLFNPYVTSGGLDKRAMLKFWRSVFDTDLDDILKEIDGEVVIRNRKDGISGIAKMKKEHPETDKFLNILKTESDVLNIGNEFNFNDNMLTIGGAPFKEQTKIYSIDKGTFLFADVDMSTLLQIPDLKVKIIGKNNKITTDVELTAASIKELEVRY